MSVVTQNASLPNQYDETLGQTALQDMRNLSLVRKGNRLFSVKDLPSAVEEKIISFLIPPFTEEALNNNQWYRYAKVFLAKQLHKKFQFSTFTLFSAIESEWKKKIDEAALYFQEVYKKYTITSALEYDWSLNAPMPMPMPSYELHMQLCSAGQTFGASPFYALLEYIACILQEHHKLLNRTRIDAFFAYQIAFKEKRTALYPIAKQNEIYSIVADVLKPWKSAHPTAPITTNPIISRSTHLFAESMQSNMAIPTARIVSLIQIHIFLNYCTSVPDIYFKLKLQELEYRERSNKLEKLAMATMVLSSISFLCITLSILIAWISTSFKSLSKIAHRFSRITIGISIVVSSINVLAAFIFFSYSSKWKFQPFSKKCRKVFNCLYIKPLKDALGPWHNRFEIAKWLVHRKTLGDAVAEATLRIQRYQTTGALRDESKSELEVFHSSQVVPT